MKNILLFFLFIMIVSCKNELKKPIIKNKKDKNEVRKVDSVKTTPKIESGKPITKLQKFVEEIEKDNWYSDTLRLKNINIYSSLKREQKYLFNKRPFYKIMFNDTDIMKGFKARIYDGKFSDSLDIEIVEKVKSIWGYFYRGKKINNTIEDGVIEQWEFKNENIARKAFKEISEFAMIAYFNTNPYLFRKENYIFIFHTRAMAFSYGQEDLYLKFKEYFSKKEINN